MDPTQELNEFLKSHPVEKKQEVPQEIQSKINIEAEKRGFDNTYALDIISFARGAEYGYKLAQEEIKLLNEEMEYQKKKKQRIFDIVKGGLSWHREQRKELKEQLAAKDKEIERLKKDLESLENYIQSGSKII